MIQLIKRLIKTVLIHFDIVIFKRSSRVYIAEDESYSIVAKLTKSHSPVIIDGGAHLGDAVQSLGALMPAATFHCFEPDPSLADELNATFRDNTSVHIVNAAIGNSIGKAMFNVNVSKPTNSLLPISEMLQSDIKSMCQLERQVEVEVTTIDAYCLKQGLKQVDVLKLDLQGYDYWALQGAEETLKRVNVVLVEVLFSEIYQGCRLFPDILYLMREAGFDLYTLCGLNYGDDSKLLWADAIFIKNSDF
jgi:FkbM family methyltransferase